MLLQGKLHEGLYQFDLEKAHPPKNLCTALLVSTLSLCVFNTTLQFSSSPSLHSPLSYNTSMLDTWQKRLGHPASAVLHNVLQSCNISIPRNKTSALCHACAIGKSHNLPFLPSQTQYHAPLELVVADLWGPAFVPSRNNFLYYLNFIDAYSRYTWIYFLHNKSEAFSAFQQFKTLAEKSLHCPILRLQTDGGGEFRSFTPFLKTHRIEHRLTCPYTSQQNGLSERKHRQIVDMGLTLLSQASIPLAFWEDAFLLQFF